MSHTQHTPGPWVVCIEDDSDAAVTIFAASQLRDGRIAADEWDDCIAIAGLNHNESEANAHLIAAAPAMLAALRAMVGVTINSGQVSDDMAPALEMALAAIKQATGEAE